MIYEFPDLDTLQLVITNGVVPTEVSLAPAAGALADGGRIRLEPSVAVPKKAQTALRKLGVVASETKANGTPAEEVSCWPQMLPVTREPGVPNLSAQAPVLFELAEPTLLAGFVGEMLRLGNDRQAFRWLKDGKHERVLLRVIGPPYYSLLRALEGTDGAASPRAYAERAPGVWVEMGCTHPLVEYLKPPAGKIVLLRAPRSWTFVEEAPYRDIYEILDFALPVAPVHWQAKDAGPRLQVPLRLIPGGTTEPAELWVLRDQAFDQVDALVRNAADPLLARLAFAVGEHEGQTSIVLRVRPSKQAPPELALRDAVEFRPFWKLPNLFIPRGRGLQPPLRRDAVRGLLADDPDQVVWLYPKGEHQFVPESLPDAAFRPLADWVDYVLDRDHQALQTWIESARFDFAAYVCKDDADATPKPPREKKPTRGRKSMLEEDVETDDAALPVPIQVVDKSRKKTAPKDEDDFTPTLTAKPSELKEKLTALEKEFEAIEGALDEPARQELWLQMAPINVALDKVSDAAICWLNAMWNQDALPAELVAAWARAEAKTTERQIPAETIDSALAITEPLPADLRTLAAAIVLAAADPAGSGAKVIVGRLPRIRSFLEKHDSRLGVRAVWLAWSSLARLAGGDVLALARTRDRLLERLITHGLSPEYDLPSFLRFAGEQSSERYRTVRDRVSLLRNKAQAWITECYSKGVQTTHASKALDTTQAYKDLLFAFGLAKLGEVGECHRLKQAATQVLGERDKVHSFLLNAFTHRIDQALAGRPHSGPLPPEFHEHLQEMALEAKKSSDERVNAYIVDRLRGESRILEPHEKIDAYRSWRKTTDDLGEQLDRLYSLTERDKLEAELTRLLAKHKKTAEVLRILTTALHQASHLSEAFAVNILGRLIALRENLATVQSLHELEQNAKVLERALFLAAHFDRAEYLQQIVATFFQLLESQRDNNFTEAVDGLAQCLRSLRKLGLRQEIDGLMARMTDLLMKGVGLAELRAKTRNSDEWADILRALLQIAGGWLYFGRTEKAMPFLDEARSLLFQEDQRPAPIKRSKLARAYAEALGQAPVDLALKRFEELFKRMGNLVDTFTTNSHYSLSQLQVVEAVVRAVVSEDFAVGQNVRRWLDEDEFLVRRRIHKDLRTLMHQAGL